MNISLTPNLDRFVQEKVKSGKYKSAIDVIREALWLLEEQDHSRLLSIEEIAQEIAIGTEQIKRGETIDSEELFQELYEDIRQISSSNQ